MGYMRTYSALAAGSRNSWCSKEQRNSEEIKEKATRKELCASSLPLNKAKQGCSYSSMTTVSLSQVRKPFQEFFLAERIYSNWAPPNKNDWLAAIRPKALGRRPPPHCHLEIARIVPQNTRNARAWANDALLERGQDNLLFYSGASLKKKIKTMEHSGILI